MRFFPTATFVALALSTTLTGAVSAQMPGRDPLAVFDQADTDHDGRISRAEFAASRAAQFAKMDRNGDGVISKADFGRIASLRPQAGERTDAMIAKMDANHDGKVTRDELASAPTRMFDRADTDRDGYVDRNELAALRTQLQRMKREQ